MTTDPDKETIATTSILDWEPELLIRYHKDTDTLILSGGVVGANGETVAKDVVAMSDNDGWVTSIVLEYAAELLQPYLLKVNQEPEPELQIHYFKDTDSLIVTSEKPGACGETVANQLIARSNDDGEVTGIEQFNAARLLRPILFPESTAKG